MNQFNIDTNDYLKTATIGYYHEVYPFDNNHPVNILKNIFGSVNNQKLTDAMNYVIQAITDDVPIIIENYNLTNCALVCVPRSKAYFTSEQLKFKAAVSIAANRLNIIDGTGYITRTINTYTTHFRNPVPNYNNDGEMPFPGIANRTCLFNENEINGKSIILIDDVYTIGSNIIEDCIQALLDYGAKRVIHYSICKTPKGN